MPWTDDTAQSYAQTGEQAHVPALVPVLTELCEPPAEALLDFGGGEGYLLSAVMEHGITARAMLVDESPTMIAAAERNFRAWGEEGVFITQGDERLLPTELKFDRILCTLVLMMCQTRDRLDRVTAGLIHSLAPRGRLLITVTHPCFHGERHEAFHTEPPAGFSYFAGGTPYEVVLHPDGGPERVRFTDYHWPAQDYVEAVARAGGAVTRMREVACDRKSDGEPAGPPAFLVMAVERAAR